MQPITVLRLADCFIVHSMHLFLVIATLMTYKTKEINLPRHSAQNDKQSTTSFTCFWAYQFICFSEWEQLYLLVAIELIYALTVIMSYTYQVWKAKVSIFSATVLDSGAIFTPPGIGSRQYLYTIKVTIMQIQLSFATKRSPILFRNCWVKNTRQLKSVHVGVLTKIENHINGARLEINGYL